MLISAVIRGKAYRIMGLVKDKTRLLTAERTIEEVRRGLIHVAQKRKLDTAALLLAVEALPVEVRPESAYRHKLAEAEKRIAKRDPTDADLLALALAEAAPIWSQDRDFEGCGVPLWTTERLL